MGGGTTVDAQTATYVVDQIRPRLMVIPMHYKTDVSTSKELAPVDAFLAGRPNVRRLRAIKGTRSWKAIPHQTEPCDLQRSRPPPCAGRGRAER